MFKKIYVWILKLFAKWKSLPKVVIVSIRNEYKNVYHVILNHWISDKLVIYKKESDNTGQKSNSWSWPRVVCS